MSLRYEIKFFKEDKYNHLDDLIKFTDVIMDSSSYLYPQTPQYLKKTLGPDTMSCICFDGDKIAGFASVADYRKKAPLYLEFLNKDFSNSAALDLYMVDSKYVGNNIAYTMGALLLKELKSENLDNVYLTVHPDNIPSCKISNKLGFTELDRREVFPEKLLRKIMLKTL